MQNALKESIKKLIVEGKTRKAIDQLKIAVPSTSSKKMLTVIESELTIVRKKELSGTLSHAEIQLAKNQINEKLLDILEGESEVTGEKNSSNFLKILIPVALIALGGFGWWMMQSAAYECPQFSEKINNKILIVPFINVDGEDKKPHTLLRDRINELTLKKDLSSEAMIGEPNESITPRNAAELNTNCNSNVLVWGTYAANSDSIQIFLNYYFSHQPDYNVFGEKSTLKNITEIQSGKMNKTLEDAIFSLCGIIALREGNAPVAKKWFEKVKVKEEFDEKFLEKL